MALRAPHALLGLMALSACDSSSPGAGEVKVQWVAPGQLASESAAGAATHRDPVARWAKRPRFRKPVEQGSLRAQPDGQLGEWRDGASVRWLEKGKRVAGAKQFSGESDLSVRVGWGSYSGGLSLAVVAKDDRHVPAKHFGAFGKADWVELALWPRAAGPDQAKAEHPALGVAFRLGTFKQLVSFVRPADESWRAAAVQSFGAEVVGGWQLEARIPASVLTPLPSAKVERLRYVLTVHDADQQDSEPTLRFEGELSLKVPMMVPEAVQRRLSVRACMARFDGFAFWSYQNGWRCGLPFMDGRPRNDDTAAGAQRYRFSHLRMPEPPRLVFLRERLLFFNYPLLGRGLAALVSKSKQIHSLMDLGVVGADEPGNALTRESDAEPLRLPDGTWAVAITHAYPIRSRGRLPKEPQRPNKASAVPFGESCAAGHEIYASIIAAFGAPHVTPDRVVPEPDPAPKLREVFRLKVGDCRARSVFDWQLSDDRKRIVVRDVLNPASAKRVYLFSQGRYRRVATPGARSGSLVTKAGTASGTRGKRVGQQ